MTPPGLTRPDRPGDRLGPTSGGSIGYRGWQDSSSRLTFCSAVPAVHSDMPVWYGALYCIPPDLACPDRPGYRLGPTYGGSIGSQGWRDTSYLLLHLPPPAPQYLQYTAIWEYAMEHCTVSHLTSTGPHRPGYHMGPTSGGSIGSQGMGDPVYLLVLCAAVPLTDCRMTSTRLHVA